MLARWRGVYGQRLNAIEFKTAIDKLNQLYQTQGYNLAQVVDIEELNPDGKLTVVVAEGSIEDVRVRFLNKKGEAVDENKQPYSGQTRPFIIIREAESKSGKIFNRNIIRPPAKVFDRSFNINHFGHY